MIAINPSPKTAQVHEILYQRPLTRWRARHVNEAFPGSLNRPKREQNSQDAQTAK
jgi:hypothetical protein